jgi:hypothetical protein
LRIYEKGGVAEMSGVVHGGGGLQARVGGIGADDLEVCGISEEKVKEVVKTYEELVWTAFGMGDGGRSMRSRRESRSVSVAVACRMVGVSYVEFSRGVGRYAGGKYATDLALVEDLAVDLVKGMVRKGALGCGEGGVGGDDDEGASGKGGKKGRGGGGGGNGEDSTRALLDFVRSEEEAVRDGKSPVQRMLGGAVLGGGGKASGGGGEAMVEIRAVQIAKTLGPTFREPLGVQELSRLEDVERTMEKRRQASENRRMLGAEDWREMPKVVGLPDAGVEVEAGLELNGEEGADDAE